MYFPTIGGSATAVELAYQRAGDGPLHSRSASGGVRLAEYDPDDVAGDKQFLICGNGVGE
jgi:hypothetical protein